MANALTRVCSHFPALRPATHLVSKTLYSSIGTVSNRAFSSEISQKRPILNGRVLSLLGPDPIYIRGVISLLRDVRMIEIPRGALTPNREDLENLLHAICDLKPDSFEIITNPKEKGETLRFECATGAELAMISGKISQSKDKLDLRIALRHELVNEIILLLSLNSKDAEFMLTYSVRH